MSSDPGLPGLLSRLLAATLNTDVEAIYSELLAMGALERPVGDRKGNLPTIHVTSDPDGTFAERITNAIDATFEWKVAQDPNLRSLKSPRDLLKSAYGVPNGTLTILPQKQKEQLVKDGGVIVRILHGNAPETPTMEVRDHGIGVLAEEFPRSIMSLNEDNKISSWYLMGRYGQGGSTTLRFSDYTIIVSRKQGAESTVAFTIAKYNPPQGNDKGGQYVYLVGPDNVPYSVPYTTVDFEPGTLVRLLNYRFSRKMVFLDVYAVLERQLFDPVLPFWLVEERTRRREDRRRIYGSRDHLSRTDYVPHKEEYTVPVNHDPALGSLTIRYWVFRSGTETKVKQTFINPDNPIAVTYLGQTHDQLPRRLLNNECKLPYLYKDLAVQVDLDGITDQARHRIFTSDRERVTKEGRQLIETALVKALRDDPDLRELESQREHEFFSGKTGKETEQMRRKLAELINRIKPGTFTIKAGGREKQRRRGRKGGGGRGGKEPLATGTFPTYLEIANKAPLRIATGGHARVELNSDSPDGFLSSQNGDAEVVLTPEALDKVGLTASHSDFLGGRLYLRVEPKEGVAPGTKFSFGAVLKCRQDDGNLVEFPASIEAVVEGPKTGGEGKNEKLWAPNIVKVGPDLGGEGQKFYEASGWSEKDVAEVKESADSIAIFVSVANRWLLGALRSAKLTVASKERLRDKYALHVALHAYLQEDRYKGITEGIEEAVREQMKMEELDRAARSLITALTSEGAFKDEPVDD